MGNGLIQPAPVGAGDICTDCALCCDGTIFDFVPLEVGEAESLAGLGAKLNDRQGKAAMQQPCSLLCGSRCGQYLERPATCRDYRCITLAALEDGEIAESEARRRIEAALKARERLLDMLGPEPDMAEARALWTQSTAAPPADKQAARLHFLATALNLILDRHFRKPGQRIAHFMEGG